MKHTFDRGPEGFCSYEYHAGKRARRNMFILVIWEKSGGINDSGYIWSDEHGWSADTPEDPISVFPFDLRRQWVGEGPVDLRNADVSVYLRGDGLELHGSKALFWVVSGGTSWHLDSHPIEIAEGRWPDQPDQFTLTDDESLWHRTWSGDPSNIPPLSDVLANCTSYAIQLSGFTALPTGRISMDELEITLAG